MQTCAAQCPVRQKAHAIASPARTIRQATSQADLDAVRALCRAYREALVQATSDRPEMAEAYYSVRDFDALLADLPRLHAPPDGAIFLGLLGEAPLACGMTHRIDTDTCEIKRVFTAPQARGTGLARAIMHHAMDTARAQGYRRMVLDTMAPLTAAAALYQSLGFTKAAPFYTPDPAHADYLAFFEITL